MERNQFEINFRRLRPGLYLYAVKFMKTVEDAEDALTDAAAKIYVKGLDGVQDVDAYFYKTLKNTCIDMLRKRGVMPTIGPIGDVGEAVELESDSRPDYAVIEADIMRKLWAEVDKLPTKYREALILRIKEEMTYDEIGLAINKTPKVAREYCKKAILLLRMHMAASKIFMSSSVILYLLGGGNLHS